MIAAVLLLVCANAFAQSALETLQTRVAQPETLRGTFTQQKHLAGFRNPLRSSGTFLLQHDRGIVWDTLKPFPAGMIVTGTSVRSRAADGSTRVEVDAQTQPALAAVNRLLFALFAGNIAALSERFDATADADAERWTLALVPKPGGLADVITRIDLDGDRYVRHVRIEERGGDITDIAFADLDAAPLTPDEARRFD